MVCNAVLAGINSLAILRPGAGPFCDPHLRLTTPASIGNAPRTEAKFKIEAGAANRALLLALLISEQSADRSFNFADSLRSIEGNSGSG